MNALLSGTALTLCALAVTSHRWATTQVEPQSVSKDSSEGADVEWRKGLAEALAEARRTQRPLLAVFR